MSDNYRHTTISADEKAKLTQFEEKFVTGRIAKTRNNPNEIQLLGFTSVEYFGDNKVKTKETWEKYSREIADTKCTFTTFDGSYMRVYYPLHTAVVTYKGKTYVADKNGFVLIDGVKNLSDIKVIGRKASDTVVPINKSVLKKGNVMLHKKLTTKNTYAGQMTLIFDLEYRYPNCCKTKQTSWFKSLGEEEEAGPVSCTQNHGGSRNCTEAFPDVATKRCETYYDRCMDYNGWGTDCSGSDYFAGSDCFWALAQGEC